MKDDTRISVKPDLFLTGMHQLYETTENKIARLETENAILTEELAAERTARYNAERLVEDYRRRIAEFETPKHRKRKAIEEQIISEFKSDGKRKARPAEPIRSYEDFKAIQDYFLDKGRLRDYMMWTMGVAFGLRISDLLSLKIKNILNDDLTFRKHITIMEQKTSKLNNCLITEVIIDAATKYFDSIEWKFDLNDYLFASKKTKGKMYEEYGWKILSDAGKALDLPINIGSHTMRKSFANIVACVDKSTIDMNSITKIQGLLNHSDQKTTMKYLGKFAEMYDKARVTVSDFLLGKTGVHELIAGTAYTLDDIVDKLDSIENKLKGEIQN